MRYTVLDVKTTHVVVEFEDATVARVPLSADMNLESIELEISKFFRVPIEGYKSIDDVPLKIGSSGDVIPYQEYHEKLMAEQAKVQEEQLEVERQKIEEEETKKRLEGFQRKVDYKEMRRTEYPSIEDQLDALYWARNGQPELLNAMDAEFAEIKAKYPKTMKAVTAEQFYGKIPKVMIDGELVDVPIDKL